MKNFNTEKNYMHGNQYFRLLRHEVESFVKEKYGKNYLKKEKTKNELSQVNKEIRILKRQLKSLEEKKLDLLVKIDRQKL